MTPQKNQKHPTSDAINNFNPASSALWKESAPALTAVDKPEYGR